MMSRLIKIIIIKMLTSPEFSLSLTPLEIIIIKADVAFFFIIKADVAFCPPPVLSHYTALFPGFSLTERQRCYSGRGFVLFHFFFSL